MTDQELFDKVNALVKLSVDASIEEAQNLVDTLRDHPDINFLRSLPEQISPENALDDWIDSWC
jgi:hypothetical protein